jgi:hypothetical protein
VTTIETANFGVGTFSPPVVIASECVTVSAPRKRKAVGKVQLTHEQFLKLALKHRPPATWYEESAHLPRQSDDR